MEQVIKYGVLCFALLLLMLCLAAGCIESDPPYPPPRPPYGVAQITLLLGTDTLRYLPGDSASTPVTVIVLSRQGTVMSGQIVSMSLANPSLGFLQYMNPVLMDTTDHQGRVNMQFVAFGFGTDTIFASVSGMSAMKQIVLWPGMPIGGSIAGP